MEEIKKIENPTSRLRAFSRRRNNLIKKANKLVRECGVEVSVVVISPSGQFSHFSSDHNMSSILERYIRLSLETRHANDPKLKEKQAILVQLEPIQGIENKCLYLDLQSSCLEKQVNISKFERELTEAALRNFELTPARDPSGGQLDLCEENLMRSLNHLAEKKNELIVKELTKCPFEPSSTLFASKKIEDMKQALPEKSATSILMQLDPWISPFSTKIRESILEEVKKDENGAKVKTAECSSISRSQPVTEPASISNVNLNSDQALKHCSKGESILRDQSGLEQDANGSGTFRTVAHPETFGGNMEGGNTNFPFPAFSSLKPAAVESDSIQCLSEGDNVEDDHECKDDEFMGSRRNAAGKMMLSSNAE